MNSFITLLCRWSLTLSCVPPSSGKTTPKPSSEGEANVETSVEQAIHSFTPSTNNSLFLVAKPIGS